MSIEGTFFSAALDWLGRVAFAVAGYLWIRQNKQSEDITQIRVMVQTLVTRDDLQRQSDKVRDELKQHAADDDESMKSTLSHIERMEMQAQSGRERVAVELNNLGIHIATLTERTTNMTNRLNELIDLHNGDNKR